MKVNPAARRGFFGSIASFVLLAGLAPATASADVLPIPSAPVPVVNAPVELPSVTETTAPADAVTSTIDESIDAAAAVVRDVAIAQPVEAVKPVAESIATVVEGVETTGVVKRAAATADEVVRAVPRADASVLSTTQPSRPSPPTAAPPHTDAESTPPPAAPGAERAVPKRNSAASYRRAEAGSAPAPARAAVKTPMSAFATRETACRGCNPLAATSRTATPMAVAPPATFTRGGRAIPEPPPAPPAPLEVVGAVAAAAFSSTSFLIVVLALYLLIRLPQWLKVPLEPGSLRRSLFSRPLERPG